MAADPLYSPHELIVQARGMLGVEPAVVAGAMWGQTDPLSVVQAQTLVAEFLNETVASPALPGHPAYVGELLLFPAFQPGFLYPTNSAVWVGGGLWIRNAPGGVAADTWLADQPNWTAAAGNSTSLDSTDADIKPLGAAASAGASGQAARADHIHPRPTPTDIGAAGLGANGLLLPSQSPPIPSWAPNTAYKAGQVVVANNLLQAAKVDFTSAATFNQANWLPRSALTGVGVGSAARADDGRLRQSVYSRARFVVFSFAFPGRVRYAERRIRLIIRNDSPVTHQVAYYTNSIYAVNGFVPNANAPGSGWQDIPPGQEWVEGYSEAAVFIRPKVSTDQNLYTVEVEAEVML